MTEAAEKAEEIIAKTKEMEAEIEKRLVQSLRENELTEEKAAKVIEAINSNLGDEELIALLRDEFTPDMIDRILHLL